MLFAVLAVSGCRNPTGFFYELQATLEFSPITTINTPYEFASVAQATFSEQKFDAQNTRAGLIQSAIPFRVDIQANSTTTQTNFLKTIEVYIKGEGLEPLIIGEMTQVPDGSAWVGIPLNIVPSDAKEHIEKDNFQVIVKLTADQPMNVAETYWVNLGFNVEAKTMRF